MKNKYHGTVFIMKPWKEKAQSVMILRGEFVKTTTQFHCLFTVVARAFTQWVTSELIFLLGLTVNLPKKNPKKLFYVCEAASDILLSTLFFFSCQQFLCNRRGKQERRAAHKLTKHRSHSDVTFVQRRLARL